MKFGMFHIAPWHESRTAEQTLAEALEGIELADGLGFEGVWLGEHHFSRHGILSGIFSFAGHVAARTKNMRIGTAVVVLPFHNPILVAEEAAMLDVLSGGRLDLGVGAGYQRMEFNGIGVDIEESRDRFSEYLDVMIEAWTKETVTYHGKFVNIDDVWVIPKPVQKPHPPLYVAVSTSPASADAAAKRGLPVILGGPTATMGQASEALATWRARMEHYGHPHAHLDPPVLMNVYVAPTKEEAERDPAGFENFTVNVLAKVGSPARKDGTFPAGYESWATRQQDREIASTSGTRRLSGTPDMVIEQVEKFRAQGINHIFGWFGFPGMPHDKVMRSIDLFATKVMPAFAQKQPAPR